MARRRKANFFADGFLLINKPEGPTSHDVVARLRGRFKPAKIGHAGTLDPFASGLLILAFNRSTRLIDLLGQGAKTYRAVVSLGAATDTGDPTGEVISESPVPELDKERITEILQGMVGQRMQAPPAYSAAKHEGKPLYAYARKGINIEKPPKRIEIYSAGLLKLGEKDLEFEVSCSRGTYIRPLGEEIARALGTVGHLTSLVRTGSAPFGLDQACDLDKARSLTAEQLAGEMLEISEALGMMGVGNVTLDQDSAWELRQGRILNRDLFLAGSQGKVAGKGEPFMVHDPQGELVAVLRWLGPLDARPGREYETIRVFPDNQAKDPAAQGKTPLLHVE